MREDLAREFPEAVRAFAWTRARLPARMALVRRESVLWGTMSALGAGFLVSAITQFLVGLSFDVLRLFGVTSPLAPGWLQALLGTAAGGAVALRAGGPVALALYLAYLAVDITLQIPSVRTFCERSGFVNPLAPDTCTPLGFLAAHWAQWSGIGLGLLLSRTIAARDEGANLTLRVAGTYAIVWSIAPRAWSMAVVQADQAGALNASLTISVLAAAAAVAAGVVAGLSERRVRTATIVAVILVLPWLTALPFLITQVGATSAEFLPSVLVVTLSTPIAAIVLVFAAVIADRQRFIPREPR